MHGAISSTHAITQNPFWASLLARDNAADGVFVYSVSSTGVYCRPSCAARRPRPENVRFHASCAAAEAAGFRPCRRCRPNEASRAEADATKIAAACRQIETAAQAPPLQTLAAAAGLSQFHFHRLFKTVTGVTPRAYATAHRAQRLRDALRQPGTITAAVYESGFNSSSRFYASAEPALGMTPAAFRAGGAGETIRYSTATCSLGAILVARSHAGICAITLGDDPDVLVRNLQNRFAHAMLTAGDAEFNQIMAAVISHVEAPALGLALPLDIRGTTFQLRVWQALREIPPGNTATYTQLAAKIGQPNAARAVAGACAANKLAVAIPCHRVIRQDGNLSGYRWGVTRKRRLLAIEAAQNA